MANETTLVQLGEETIGTLRSSLRITSFADVIRHLVENALDADAKRVRVQLDLEQWTVTVEDDGRGMTGKELAHAGQTHWTTKDAGQADTYGFRGEGLASICQLGSVEIASRHRDSNKTSRAFRREGQAISVGHSQVYQMADAGTQVTVRDLFHKLPVRRRSIVQGDLSLALARQKKGVIRVLQVLAMANTTSSFELVTSDTQKALLSARSCHASNSSSLRDRFGQVISDHHTSAYDLYDLIDPDFEGTAFSSRIGSSSRSMQFIYINKHYLSPRHGLYRIAEDCVQMNLGESSTLLDGKDALADVSNMPKSPSKRGNRSHAVFVICISCSVEMLHRDGEDQSITLHPNQSSQLLRFVRDLLSLDHNRLRKSDTHRDDNSAHERSRKVRVLDLCHGIEQDLRSSPGDKIDRLNEPKIAVRQSCAPLKEPCERENKVIASHKFDTSTPAVQAPKKLVPKRSLRALHQGWHNPTFEKGEIPLPFVSLYLDQTLASGHALSNDIQDGPLDRPRLRSISRDDLAGAEVLGQVDAKFIAAKISLSNQDLYRIILIDQHAADERIRVEWILSAYFKESRNLIGLECPVTITLSSKEVELALDLIEHFREWGIDFCRTEENERQLIVTHCPALVSERLETDSSVLTELIRDHTYQYEDRQFRRRSQDNGSTATDKEDWTLDLAACPRTLIDLANSKACRGAIMFGDVLSAMECGQLVRSLAKCRWPFQCAHGRPSTVPLFEWTKSSKSGSKSRLRSGRPLGYRLVKQR